MRGRVRRLAGPKDASDERHRQLRRFRCPGQIRWPGRSHEADVGHEGDHDPSPWVDEDQGRAADDVAGVADARADRAFPELETEAVPRRPPGPRSLGREEKRPRALVEKPCASDADAEADEVLGGGEKAT